MKLSISLPDKDVEYIDRYADDHHIDSRSGVMKRAVALLRANDLGDDYAAAWSEWESAGADDWDVTVGDGVLRGDR